MRIAPNWFTAAMGTGILANAAMLLPADSAALRAFALCAWLVTVLLLLRLSALAFEQWRRDRRAERRAAPSLPGVPSAASRAERRAALSAPRAPSAARRAAGPSLATAPFWGAPPMALMTVASGTLLIGREAIGEHAAVVVALVLWTAGTLGGLAAMIAVPRWLLRHPERRLDAVFATWLLPVVPPLVSATSGAALVAHMPEGRARPALLLACCALFIASAAAAVATKVLFARRLAAHGPGPARMVPTLFIVLGPLGQSVTAICLLAAAAPGVLPAPLADRAGTLALIWGLPVFALAMIWLAVATTLTVRTATGPGLPFAATWWSFIFPIGTCVTGASELALRTGSAPLAWLAGALFALLVGAWLTVASATARHALGRRGAWRAVPAAA